MVEQASGWCRLSLQGVWFSIHLDWFSTPLVVSSDCCMREIRKVLTNTSSLPSFLLSFGKKKMVSLLLAIALMTQRVNAELGCNSNGWLRDFPNCRAGDINRVFGGSLDECYSGYVSEALLVVFPRCRLFYF